MKMPTYLRLSALRRVASSATTRRNHILEYLDWQSPTRSTRFYRNDASERYFIYEHDGKYIRVLRIREDANAGENNFPAIDIGVLHEIILTQCRDSR